MGWHRGMQMRACPADSGKPCSTCCFVQADHERVWPASDWHCQAAAFCAVQEWSPAKLQSPIANNAGDGQIWSPRNCMWMIVWPTCLEIREEQSLSLQLCAADRLAAHKHAYEQLPEGRASSNGGLLGQNYGSRWIDT